jgi:hypothetical protein
MDNVNVKVNYVTFAFTMIPTRAQSGRLQPR